MSYTNSEYQNNVTSFYTQVINDYFQGLNGLFDNYQGTPDFFNPDIYFAHLDLLSNSFTAASLAADVMEASYLGNDVAQNFKYHCSNPIPSDEAGMNKVSRHK